MSCASHLWPQTCNACHKRAIYLLIGRLYIINCCVSYAWPHIDEDSVLDLHVLIYMNMTREVASQICLSVNVPRLLFGYVVRSQPWQNIAVKLLNTSYMIHSCVCSSYTWLCSPQALIIIIIIILIFSYKCTYRE